MLMRVGGPGLSWEYVNGWGYHCSSCGYDSVRGDVVKMEPEVRETGSGVPGEAALYGEYFDVTCFGCGKGGLGFASFLGGRRGFGESWDVWVLW